MPRYIILRIVLFVCSAFVEVQNGSAFATDDLSGADKQQLSFSSPAVGPKCGLDDVDGEQRKRPRRDEPGAPFADQVEDDGGIEGREDARSFAALAGEQVYANPIFDAAAKYLFADDEVRLGFMKTFTGNPHIVSTELLDASLNPLRTLTQARAFLGDEKNTECHGQS